MCLLIHNCSRGATNPSLFPNLLKNAIIKLNSRWATKTNLSKQVLGKKPCYAYLGEPQSRSQQSYP